MNIRQVILVCNPTQPLAKQVATQLTDFLHTKKIDAHILPDYKHISSFPKADLCISLGGDGTALRCAREASLLGIAIWAVNCGSLGFLSACEVETAQEALAEVLAGKYHVSSRLLIYGEIERKNAPSVSHLLAFNDCVIKTPSPLAFTLQANWNGQNLKPFYGDGIIISTPSGSTAYSLAAGGPIVAPDLEALLVTPICPHSLTERPLVLRADGELVFSTEFKNPQEKATVSFDGQHGYELQNQDRVILRCASQKAQLICTEKFNFFNRLREKLVWGGRHA